ncbi:MAG: tRNA (adenosine(37)-N6)-threonylcarbamoyltransferase complex transferase subunit TsaD [Bacillota bacterium]
MRLLSIETSCDETAIAVIEAEGTEESARFRILGNALLSQIEIHREYGGVFPALAKREHAKNLVPLLEAALSEAELLKEDTQAFPEELTTRISTLLEREPELDEAFFASLSQMARPDIDAIAVTAGPGLEPALWVGINFAKALSVVWEKPLIAVNHMEGHLLSALAERTGGDDIVIEHVGMPVLGLLISGGHTELVAMNEWLSYELVGQTRDDAVGEAFDKVARMMDLPYPGGPEISKLAERDREDFSTMPFSLPRPMLGDSTCDFSFSGLKTAVLYLLKERGSLSEVEKEQLAREFEDAVAEVLWSKSSRAIEMTGAKTLALGGGVSANTHIRRVFTEEIERNHPEVALHIPAGEFTTDNAVMIGLAGFYRMLRGEHADLETLRANGNLSLA